MAADFKIDFFEGSTRDPYPFVVIPKKECPKWDERGAAKAKRARGAFAVMEVGGAPSLVLPGGVATTCIMHGKCAYFVRWPKYTYGDHDAKLARLIASVKDAQWKPRGTFDVASKPLLLFSAAKSPYPWGRWEMPGNYNAGAAVVPLAPGAYDVHVAEHVTGERTSLDLVRLTPVGARASAPKTVAIDPARVALERVVAKLKGVDSEGGPFVALPAALKRAWRGAKDYGAGASDYERACAIEGDGGALIEVGEGTALVIPGPESATAIEVDGAWHFITQHAAKDPVDAYAAARAVPEKSFKKQKAKLVLPAAGLELRDASTVGRATSLAVPVAAGTYDVARAVVKKPGLFLSVVRLAASSRRPAPTRRPTST